jgi:uncharacterized membrane protein YgdD (TMEM256/DUF423 family)
MDRILLIVAGVLGFSGVALGAFGAHGLRRRLEHLPDGAQRMQWWQTAAQYHLVHAIAVGLASFVAARSSAAASVAGLSFAAGVLVFSGSLYVMTVTGARKLGAVTPIGGLLLLVGWLALAVSAMSLPG